MANAIMIALGKPKKHMGMGREEPEEDESESGIDVSSEEVEAAKMMREAKNDEDYAAALKAFIKLCSMSEEGEY